MTYPQYGIYLIPPPNLTYLLGLGHHLLASEFNAPTGGRFMVHCTIKGFFKLKAGAAPEEFIPALGSLFAEMPAFTTAPVQFGASQATQYGGASGVFLERTTALHALHTSVWEVVRPYIAPDCTFSPTEGQGPNFMPHLTIGMADMPTDPALFAQAADLSRYIYDTLPKDPFLARDMQLIEFYSEDWTGRWWETLRFRQLKGWRLEKD